MLYRIYKPEPKAKRSYSSKILEIHVGMILGTKIERKVYVNEQNFVLDIQLRFFCVFFMNYSINEYYKYSM